MFGYYFDLALRSLKRSRGLTALMVLAIGFGVAASMTTFSVFRAVSGDPIPWKSSKLFVPQIDMWGPKARSDDGEPPSFVGQQAIAPVAGPRPVFAQHPLEVFGIVEAALDRIQALLQPAGVAVHGVQAEETGHRFEVACRHRGFHLFQHVHSQRTQRLCARDRVEIFVRTQPAGKRLSRTVAHPLREFGRERVLVEVVQRRIRRSGRGIVCGMHDIRIRCDRCGITRCR